MLDVRVQLVLVTSSGWSCPTIKLSAWRKVRRQLAGVRNGQGPELLRATLVVRQHAPPRPQRMPQARGDARSAS